LQDLDGYASACTASITDSLSMDPLLDCEPAQVTVTLGVTCPVRLPLHVVFVIGRHLAMEDHLAEVKSSARSAVDAVEFHDDTLMGVVSLSTQERVELPLTDRKSRVLSAISSIKLDRVQIFNRYYDWLARAEQMLLSARKDSPLPPVEVVVVYSTGCPQGLEQYCGRLVGSANRLKGQGITVIGVCNPGARPFGFPLPDGHCRTLQQMSTTGYYKNLRQSNQLGKDLIDLGGTGSKVILDKVQLVDELASNFTYLPGTEMPQPKVDGSALAFEWTNVAPGSVVTATYGITPTVAGIFPLRTTNSKATLHDSLGLVSDPITVPLRTVQVDECFPELPTATPSPTAEPSETPKPTDAPTVTPVPTVRPSATPTVVSVPGTVFLPIALSSACRPEKVFTDIALVIDASSSMEQESGGARKIDAAKDAAQSFLQYLSFAPRGNDQAAVVSFNNRPTLSSGLTSDRNVLGSAIAGIETAPGTRIDLALDVARQELSGERAREGNNPALILLTDGQPSPGTVDAVIAAADAAKREGITLFVIGLGDDVDEALLRQLATAPDLYFYAPTAAELAAIYEMIAGELPCPGGEEWTMISGTASR